MTTEQVHQILENCKRLIKEGKEEQQRQQQNQDKTKTDEEAKGNNGEVKSNS